MYEEYKNSKYWKIVKNALNDLKVNNDIEYTTKEDYVTGYIIEKLEKLWD